jgi:hypothetical protein
MRQRIAPHTLLYGPRRSETVLEAMENFISWEALRLRRGRSVFRADLGSRRRQYQRVTLTQVKPGEVCTASLPPTQECELLQHALNHARAADDQQAEHQALLLLRRLARRYEQEEMVLQCNQQLREWWRGQRQNYAEDEQS